MPKAISNDEFRAMLEDPEVPDKRIAEYLRKRARGAFNPVFEPDPDLVERDRFESALTVGNWWCRRRRRARFRHRIDHGVELPVVVSEGDSWFQFPFIIEDVIDHLEDDFLIWSCGAAGDTADNMIFENPEYMDALDEQAGRVTAFLLSAAGNDVIGEDENGVPVLSGLLHRRTASRDTAHELINKAALKRVVDKLRAAYLDVVGTVRGDARFAELPIIIHGYDYALPFPQGRNDPRDPYWAADDEWLGGPMKEKDITSAPVRREIVEILIQELYGMLSDVAATDPHIHVVDVRGTLTRARDWADEIHGTDTGFGRVATKFRKVLKRVVIPKPASAVLGGAVLGGAEMAAAPLGAIFDPIEPPDLHIETRPIEELDPGLLGFGDTGKFANGFRRTSPKLALEAVPEAAIEEDDSVPLRFLLKGAETGRAVCKIEAAGVDFRGRTGRWSGTGFLVAPNLLLTNHHVINSPDVASQSRAVFNFQETKPGDMAPTSVFTLDPNRLFVASPFSELDYCFVWVDGAPQDEFGTIAFWRGSFMGAPGAPANIIHHPDGKPKRASIEKNEIVDLGLAEVLVHYASDTERGSSGSPVLTDEWRLFALHHASTRKLSPKLRKRVSDAGYDSNILNEGIKTSAIAIDIDKRANHGPDRAAARMVQDWIGGTDSRTGFFGALGRAAEGEGGLERVVDAYRGAPGDIDIAFWNVERFHRDFRRKINDVARIVADLNLDIWAFEETSPEATEALADKMRHEFDLEFGFAASEPGASSGKQTTTVMWNKRTVRGGRLEWPREIDRILRLRSDDPGAGRFEAVEGKIFNRYPGLFRFEAVHLERGRVQFDFNLVPVHLKAMAEGAKRRRMASKILATAVAMTRGSDVAESDWVIGGDFNAELSTGQFDPLRRAGFTPMSAEDERGGAITYLGQRHRSLIDSIFLSPGMTRGVGADDFMIIAPDRADPGFIDRVSDHRPVMVRLSTGEAPFNGEAPGPDGGATAEDALLEQFLREFRDDPPGVLEELAELLRNR